MSCDLRVIRMELYRVKRVKVYASQPFFFVFAQQADRSVLTVLGKKVGRRGNAWLGLESNTNGRKRYIDTRLRGSIQDHCSLDREHPVG